MMNLPTINLLGKEGNLCGEVANVLDCKIVVSEFELQSLYYVHFRANNPEKGMNSSSLHLWIK